MFVKYLIALALLITALSLLLGGALPHTLIIVAPVHFPLLP